MALKFNILLIFWEESLTRPYWTLVYDLLLSNTLKRTFQFISIGSVQKLIEINTMNYIYIDNFYLYRIQKCHSIGIPLKPHLFWRTIPLVTIFQILNTSLSFLKACKMQVILTTEYWAVALCLVRINEKCGPLGFHPLGIRIIHLRATMISEIC